MLFESGRVRLNAQVGTHYKQGMMIGQAAAPEVAATLPRRIARLQPAGRHRRVPAA